MSDKQVVVVVDLDAEEALSGDHSALLRTAAGPPAQAGCGEKAGEGCEGAMAEDGRALLAGLPHEGRHGTESGKVTVTENGAVLLGEHFARETGAWKASAMSGAAPDASPTEEGARLEWRGERANEPRVDAENRRCGLAMSEDGEVNTKVGRQMPDRPRARLTREELFGPSDGTRIIISGTNFAGESEVSLRQGPASFEITRSGTIRAIAPPQAANSGDVPVISRGASAPDAEDELTYTAHSAPTVSCLASPGEPSEEEGVAEEWLAAMNAEELRVVLRRWYAERLWRSRRGAEGGASER